MITLYPDQQDLIDRLRLAMRHNKSVLCQSATGSGTVDMVRACAKVLIVGPRLAPERV